MPAVAPFIPLIASGVGAIAGGISNKNAGKKQDAMLAAQQQAAQQQMAQSGQLFNMGAPLVNQGATYYQKLLRGDRAALRSATSPEANEVTDIYRGAENSIRRSNLTGANRDRQMGELARERAGRIASLVPIARRAAAEQVTGLGQNLVQGGQSGLNAASGALGNVSQQNSQNQQDSDTRWGNYGKSLGGLITDVYKAWPRGGSGGGGVGKPGTTPAYSSPYGIGT